MNEDTSAKQQLFLMMESLPRDDFAHAAVMLWDILILAPMKQKPGSRPAIAHPKWMWIPPKICCVKISVDGRTTARVMQFASYAGMMMEVLG
jgi:hypothetical protein